MSPASAEPVGNRGRTDPDARIASDPYGGGMRRHVGSGTGQLERLRELASRLLIRPTRWHPGELTSFWWLDWRADGSRIAVWEDAGRCVAWARVGPSGRLDLQVDPARPTVLDDVLGWFGQQVPLAERVVTVADVENGVLDDLRRRGWQPSRGAPVFEHLEIGLDGCSRGAPLPPRVTLRHCRGPADAALRARIHRAAFGPSTAPLATAGFRRAMSDPAYRPELDWVALLDDDPVAACTTWVDVASRTAVVEPVGTHPDHRRRGLAQAVVLASLASAADLGATRARVCGRVDADDRAALATYESLGFRRFGRTVHLRAR